MRFIRNRLLGARRWHIATILYVSFFLMLILPILFVTWFAVRSFNAVLYDNVTTRAMQTLEQVSYSLDSEASRIVHTIATIANDEKVFATATKLHASETGNPQASYEASVELDHQLSNYFHYTSDIAAALFFFRGGGVYEYKQFLGLREEDLRNSEWFKRSAANVNKVHLFGAGSNLGTGTPGRMDITVSVAPRFASSFYSVENAYFIFRGSVFQQLLRTKVPEPGYFLVLSKDGSVITASDDGMIRGGVGQVPAVREALRGPRGSYVVKDGGKRSFVLYLTSENTDWKYVHVIPYEEMLSDVRQVYNRTMLVSTLGLIVFLIVSFFLVRSIAGPIKSLVRQMNRLKTGNFQEVRIEASGPAEVFVLGSSFNEMTARIEELIREREEKEAQRSRAEITALQSQINPHFLVNTLNAMKIMAMMSKSVNIQKMTEALMYLVSSAFNRGGSHTTVDEELQLLEHYVTIMKMRYGDRFEIRMEIDGRIRGAYMLRLLLQPLVENSIVHGFHGLNRKGAIRIEGRLTEEGAVEFAVEDNGKGFEGEAELLGRETSGETFNGIGLRNVHRRIQLNYGPAYGMTIASSVGDGTRITLLLPWLEKDPESQKAAPGKGA
ncbi:sensor histidine kinase [Cohnella sp. CFH 77786]|uniref:cache domain-containing sensor histidine kinase n=1 Tax=Cohnella sp. CFH 77786 TaxID=2662265 RepID=UPI001C60CF2B|nr:sensor histidine kinase [Cohnella sp. CFH 77786]